MLVVIPFVAAGAVGWAHQPASRRGLFRAASSAASSIPRGGDILRLLQRESLGPPALARSANVCRTGICTPINNGKRPVSSTITAETTPTKRKAAGIRQPFARSRVGNGKDLIAGLDKRSLAYR